jgi:opacity protein-like surface antigen
MRSGWVLMLAGLALVGTPASARADILLTPFAGVSFFDGDPKANFGATVGFGGLIGFEVDASRTRIGTFRDIPVVSLTADVDTVMANIVIRVPAGPVQPYASGGLGLMRLSGNVRVPVLGSVLSAGSQDLGVNVGGGVYLFPSRNIGLRGDLRYFRTAGNITLSDLTNIGSIDDLPLPRLDFWRATAGVTFRF